MVRRRALVLILCFCLLFVQLPNTASPAAAATSAELQEELDELEARQEELDRQLAALEQQRKENAQQLSELTSEKMILDQQISLLHLQVTSVEQQVTALKQLIADKHDEVEHLQARYDALREASRERIRIMEENGSLSYWSILFHANSFTDFLDRVNMINEIAAADQKRIEALQEAYRTLSDARAQLQAQELQLSENLDQLEENTARLALKRAEFDRLLQLLAEKDAEFEAYIEEGEAAQQKLMEQIAQKKDEFDKAAYEEWLAANPPSGGTVPPADSGEWLVPVPYYTLTSPFGMRMHPIYGEYRMHNGIDMACAAMTPIYASRGGQVEIAVYSSTAGNYVQLNHGDGYRSVYMHMTYYTVSAGQYVQAGQLIGYVGNTGASKGNHLHFGISLNGSYIDPYPLIRGK